jgi:sporulation protein YlmC with PRC-barrel domain
MELKTKYTALAVAMAFVAGTAAAQHTDEFTRSVSHEDYRKGAGLRASDLVGANVENAEGDTVGEIEELVIPSGDQDDIRVIVSVGGVLDVGDKLVALPYDDLRVSPDGDTFYIDRSEAQLKQAPEFKYDAQADAGRTTQRAPTATNDRTTDRATNDRVTPDRPRTTAQTAVTPAKSNVALDVFDHRASEIIGATVVDDRGESVAKIDDIVVSIDDHKLHAVLAFGGFVGFGEKLITLPLDGLQITPTDGDPKVRIPMTGEQLEQLVESRPAFHYERQVAQAPGNAPRG